MNYIIEKTKDYYRGYGEGYALGLTEGLKLPPSKPFNVFGFQIWILSPKHQAKKAEARGRERY